MENQKKWNECGTEFSSALLALVNFEKNYRPELEKKIQEHSELESRAEKLSAQLTADQVAFDKRKGVFFADLAQREAKLKSEWMKENTKPVEKFKTIVSVSEERRQEEILFDLEERAKKIVGLRGQALGLLELERDHAALRMKISAQSELPFQARRQAARQLFLSMMHVAGVLLKYQTSDYSFAGTLQWSSEMKGLAERLAIAAGKLKYFPTLSFQADSADQILEFGLYLPAADFEQVLYCWRAVKVAGGKSANLTYDSRRILKYRFPKNREQGSKRMIASSDYSSGSASRVKAVVEFPPYIDPGLK